jgi:hypothetical protein
MSRAFVNEDAGGEGPLIRSSREGAENAADVYREIEPDRDFEVRPGRGGWMIARLNKDGTFESWVEE